MMNAGLRRKKAVRWQDNSRAVTLRWTSVGFGELVSRHTHTHTHNNNDNTTAYVLGFVLEPNTAFVASVWERSLWFA